MSNPVNISALLSSAAQLQRQGVKYLLDGKVGNLKANPRSTGHLSTPLDTIDHLDCSGFIRYMFYRAAGGLVIPDGSQNQLEWFQDNTFPVVKPYASVNANGGNPALHIAFIKPHVNGCGDIGHVWFVYKPDDATAAETLESHGGGAGVDSRPWNTIILAHEEYTAFRLQTV